MSSSRAHLIALAFASLGLAVAACGGDSEPKTQTDTRDTADSDAPDPSGCKTLTVTDLGPLVFDGQDDVSTSYSLPLKVSVGGPAADYLVLQFINYNERIDNGAGTFALDEAPNDNFGTCPECVAIWVDQPTPSLQPSKFLFQSSGQIVLDLDPRTRRLVGRLEGVTFREIAVDPMTLSSTFVEGGDCVVLSEPLPFDFRWVPETWTCPADTYHFDDGCDCDCGEIDPDCYPSWETPLAVPSDDCTGGKLCVEDRCVGTCSIGFGGAEPKACDGGEVCALELPDDLCLADEPVDTAALGQSCSTFSTLCAVTNGLAKGLCASDEGRLCSPLCASKDDCEPDQNCYIVRGDWAAGVGKGYCTDGPPSAWFCEADKWEDGATCHCGCGLADPDCANPALPIDGCDGACGADGTCPE